MTTPIDDDLPPINERRPVQRSGPPRIPPGSPRGFRWRWGVPSAHWPWLLRVINGACVLGILGAVLFLPLAFWIQWDQRVMRANLKYQRDQALTTYGSTTIEVPEPTDVFAAWRSFLVCAVAGYLLSHIAGELTTLREVMARPDDKPRA